MMGQIVFVSLEYVWKMFCFLEIVYGSHLGMRVRYDSILASERAYTKQFVKMELCGLPWIHPLCFTVNVWMKNNKSRSNMKMISFVLEGYCSRERF